MQVTFIFVSHTLFLREIDRRYSSYLLPCVSDTMDDVMSVVDRVVFSL